MWSVAEGVSCAGGGVVWISGSLSPPRCSRGRVGVWARATAHTRHPTPHTRAQYTNENELKTQIIHTHSFL